MEVSVTTVILGTLLLSHIIYGITIYLKIKLRTKFLYPKSFQHCSIYQVLLLEIIIEKKMIVWVYIVITKEKKNFLLRGIKHFYTRKPSG